MSKYPAFTVMMLSVALVAAAPVQRAGEWAVTIGDNNPQLFCRVADATLDQDTLNRHAAGTGCSVTSVDTVGTVTTVATQCTIEGTVRTSNLIITQDGPDSLSTKMHMHIGEMKLPNGKTMTIPDTDIITVSRRLGPCKPGDKPYPD